MFSGTIFSRAARPPEDIRLPRSCWTFFQHVDGSTTVADIAHELDLSDAEAFAAIRLLQSHGLIEEASMTFSEFQDYADGVIAADQPDGGAGPARPHSAGGDAAGDGTMPAQPQPAETSQERVQPEEVQPEEVQPEEIPQEEQGREERGQEESGQEAAPETGSYSTQAVETSAFSPGSAPVDTGTQRVPTLDLTRFWEWLEGKSKNVKNYKNTQAFILMEASGALSSIGVESMDALEAMEECDAPNVIEALEQAVENNMNETIPESCYK